MQTTLLGLAIALILALVAALVAPLVVDWNHYRATVEAEATRLIGVQVRVGGRIDARLLPSPVITLHDVSVGGAGQQPQLAAGTLKLELSLGPLLRGEVQASNVDLIGPQLSLGLDRSGAVTWPQPPASFRPGDISVSHFNIEDGRITLTDAASGTRLVLRQIALDFDVSAFTGAFKGDGDVVAGDELFHYRFSGSRAGGSPAIKIKLGVFPTNHPLTADLDGTLTFARGVPQFDGAMALARPVGATLANGRRVVNAPWRATGAIRATPAAAALQQVAFRYGPEDRALNFTGGGTLTFGPHPHLDGEIAALQLDLDQALAAPDLTSRPPFLMLRSFLQAFVTDVKLPVPAQLRIGIDALTVGGSALEAVHGTLRSDASGWNLGDFSFRAPGMTEVTLNGRLTGTPQGFAFQGPGTLHAGDVDMLTAWLNSRGGGRLPGAAKAMSARGNITIGSDRMAIADLAATLDQEKIEGRLAYNLPVPGHPARLDAGLRAASLDLDALTAFVKATLGENGLALPQEGTLALDIGNATLAGVNAQAVNAQVKFDSGTLQIDRLSIADLGGATLAVSGRIDELSSQPRGQLTFDLDARALQGLNDIAAKFAPNAAGFLHRAAALLAPAKVHAVLDVDHGAASDSIATLHLNGSLAAMQVVIDGKATGAPARAGAANFRLDGRIDAADGSALVALAGLDRVLAVDQLPGQLTVSADGSLDGGVRLDGKLTASGLQTAIGGMLHLGGNASPIGTLRLTASAADLRPLQQAMTGQPPAAPTIANAAMPVAVRAVLGLKGKELSFTDLSATVGKSTLKGRLAVDLAEPPGISGGIEADQVDAAAVMALLFGLPGGSPAAAAWSSRPIGSGAFGAVNGAVTFKFDRAALSPALEASDLKGTVIFRPSAISLDQIDGGFAGGRVTGSLAMRRDPNGLGAHVDVRIAGARAGILLGPSMNATGGVLSMSLQCDGFGASPLGLIGSLRGTAATSLKDGRFAGLDAAAFQVAMRAAGQGGAIDVSKVGPAVNAVLAAGHLAVTQADAGLAISAGVVDLSHVTLRAQGKAELDPKLSLSGLVDLGNDAIDARMRLSQAPPANALIRTRPELSVALKGPLGSPQRTLDISALTSWLTLNEAELQTRHIEAIEANRRVDPAGVNVHAAAPDAHLAPQGVVVGTAISPHQTGTLPDATALERLPQQAAPSVTTDPAPPDPGSAAPGGAAGPAAPSATRAAKPNEPRRQAPRAPSETSLLDLLFGRHH